MSLKRRGRVSVRERVEDNREVERQKDIGPKEAIYHVGLAYLLLVRQWDAMARLEQ